MADESEKTGNSGKAEEYSIVSNCLADEAFREEYSRFYFDLGSFLHYRPRFEDISYSWPRYIKSHYGNIWNWLTDRWNWYGIHTSPGFLKFFYDIYRNVETFFLWHLSPWCHIRYRFLNAFVNWNDCKLLDDGMNFAYIRNRQSDCVYYTLKFMGFHYVLKKTRILKDGEEGGQNAFISGILLGFGTDEEDLEEEKAKFHEVTEKVTSGWVFGYRSAVREMEKIAELTPDLSWRKA